MWVLWMNICLVSYCYSFANLFPNPITGQGVCLCCKLRQLGCYSWHQYPNKMIKLVQFLYWFNDSLILSCALNRKFVSLTSTEILNHLISNQNEYCMEVCKNILLVLLLSLCNIKLKHCIYFRLLQRLWLMLRVVPSSHTKEEFRYTLLLDLNNFLVHCWFVVTVVADRLFAYGSTWNLQSNI